MALLLPALLACAAFQGAHCQSRPLPPLDPQLQAWRRAHTVVQVGVFAGDHMPAEAWVGGQPQGLGIDYVSLLAARAGLRLEFHPYTDWGAVAFDGSLGKAFDLLPAQGVTPQRRDHFDFLKPYATVVPVLVVRKGDARIRDDGDLVRARIVIERRFRTAAHDVSQRYPQATVLYCNDGREALDMLVRGEADAYVGTGAARTRALLDRRPTDDLVLLASLPLPTFDIAPAVRRGNTALLRTLRKAESTVTERELTQLRLRWGMVEDAAANARSTRAPSADERAWLLGLPTLRVGYEVDRHPYSFVDGEGEFTGLSADYLRIIQRELGLRLEMVPAEDWDSLQRMVRSHEIDLIAAGTARDFDPLEMSFAQPYEYFPQVIVARNGGPPITRLRDLIGKQVAFRKETALLSLLRANLPGTRLLPTASNEAGLSRLANGQADAFIGTLPAIDSLIRSRYAAQLRVVGPAGMDQELAIGARPEFSALLQLIDRRLAHLDEGIKAGIRSRWISSEYNYGVPWKWVIGAALAGLLVLGLILAAYARLRRAANAQHAAEQQLAAQLGFREALLEIIPYPVFVKDAEGRYLGVNRAYEEQMNCRRQDLLGKTLPQTRHLSGFDAELLQAEDLAALASGRGSRRELQQPAADGSVHSMIVWLLPFSDPSNGRTILLGTFVDISEARAAETRARSSEQRLSEFAQAIPGVVFRLCIHPDGSRRFTYVAGDSASLLGMSAEQLTSDEPALFARVHPDDQRIVAANVGESAAMLRPMRAFDFRVQVIGQWRWLRTEGGQPLRLADGSVEWSGYWIETTLLHEQAADLIAAKSQAEAATAAKSAFLAAMSHEIRTPMADVLGLVELIERTTLDRDQAAMTGMVQDSARSLLQILDDILDFSRIESGHLRIESAPFDLRELLDGVVGLFRARAHGKGLGLHCIVDWRLSGTYEGDTVRIRQIVTNLLSNAIKFTARGTVTVHAELAARGVGAQDVRFSIIDTGIGIGPDNLARLFQPFTQAEDSTARRYGGTGLGLSISRRLARMMDGDVSLHSIPGDGTRAVLELPLRAIAPVTVRPELLGKVAALVGQQALCARELANSLSALGLQVMEIDRSEWTPESLGDIDLLVTAAGEADDLDVPDEVPRLLVDTGDHGSWRPVPDGIRMPGSPLLWRNIVGACCRIFGAPAPQAPPQHAIAPVRSSARILVADDHPTNRALLARQLDMLGHRATVVADGNLALEALAQDRYELLISDCHMPNLDGYALARRIRSAERAGARLAIVGISASALPEQIQRCRDAGMDDFLTKPIQLQALATLLASHLGGSPYPVPPPAGLPAEQPVESQVEPRVDVPGEMRWLATLIQAFGGREQVRGFMLDLLSTCRADEAEYDGLDTQDDRVRHELLHRMEGGLDIIEPLRATVAEDSSGPGLAARRAAAHERLRQLEVLIEGLDTTGLRAVVTQPS
jgi:two-component system sensor histidine kinase EvgS